MSPETGNVNSIGVVLIVDGEVFLRSESGMRQVQSGAEVYQGEELVTGAGSSAEVRFADDTLLSQGADSVISLDDYIFDPDSESASSLLFKMGQGTFRMVTGKIAEQNPDRFQIGSPLATIGIRGTTTVHEISPGGREKHGVEEIHSGKALLIQSIDGEVRMISSPQALVDIAASGQLSTVRPMTVQEFNTFREIAPEAIQQEQEIQEQREQEEGQQDDQQAGDEQGGAEQGQGEGEEGEQQADGEGEAEQQGEPAEGGETGVQQIVGEGVLEAGVAAIIEGAIEGNIEGPEGIQTAINEVAQGVAGQAFEALEQGDVATAQALLDKLGDIPTEEDILELIEGITDGTADVPEGVESVTYTSSDGINYILGANTGESWSGTSGTDYYDGQGGDDTISGLEGADGLRGGTGNDTINGNCGNDSIEGGEGDDTIYGGNENDVIDGQAGDDTIYGEAGTDVIKGGAGNDILHGGAGSDNIDGGDGIDFVSYAGSDYVWVDLAHSGFQASSAGATDIITNVEAVMGSDQADDLKGDGNDNTFYGGKGADTIIGGGGNDTTSYENDTNAVEVILTDGAGTAQGTDAGNDKFINISNVIGSKGSDTITGNNSSNTLFGHDGNDTLTGQQGSDTLQGGDGVDKLTGGAQADSFYYHERGIGIDFITDFNSGENDKFLFNNDNYEALSGQGGTASFETVTDLANITASGPVYIHLDSTKDELYYDPDGVGGDSAELIADTNGVAITGGDIGFI